ncbi:uncharacterized protein LOC117592742 isoform X2 [Esox lucius]|uniref:uncharacterized protein LOC117592742 isoform X2 n=1 Tax=Esox lucius TaxID=8010 RepID=UPI0014777779|nr:uncharacterized protein LOC117592742 isoform X2 [Esox lucius]
MREHDKRERREQPERALAVPDRGPNVSGNGGCRYGHDSYFPPREGGRYDKNVPSHRHGKPRSHFTEKHETSPVKKNIEASSPCNPYGEYRFPIIRKSHRKRSWRYSGHTNTGEALGDGTAATVELLTDSGSGDDTVGVYDTCASKVADKTGCDASKSPEHPTTRTKRARAHYPERAADTDECVPPVDSPQATSTSVTRNPVSHPDSSDTNKCSCPTCASKIVEHTVSYTSRSPECATSRPKRTGVPGLERTADTDNCFSAVHKAQATYEPQECGSDSQHKYQDAVSAVESEPISRDHHDTDTVETGSQFVVGDAAKSDETGSQEPESGSIAVDPENSVEAEPKEPLPTVPTKCKISYTVAAAEEAVSAKAVAEILCDTSENNATTVDYMSCAMSDESNPEEMDVVRRNQSVPHLESQRSQRPIPVLQQVPITQENLVVLDVTHSSSASLKQAEVSRNVLYPPLLQPEAAVPSKEVTPEPPPEHPESIQLMLAMVKQLILCSSCNKTFNRSVICQKYLIQLNKPIQCACGCVICTLCYREQHGCHMHSILSTQGAVNVTASTLASCPSLEHVGDWDLELNPDDRFKTDSEMNGYVQEIMNEEHAPGVDKLRIAFNQLMKANDGMAFKYWANESMSEEVAYRYVCIPHIPGFWDHVVVGTRARPKMDRMIGPDIYLPRLFNVLLGPYTFHWCCFVLKTQVILAMWCSSVCVTGQLKVLPLVDNTLNNFTSAIEFRRMLFYLTRWFKAQYGSTVERQLKVVLDCKPSEGSSLVHVIAILAWRCGMESVTLKNHFSQPRADIDMNYSISLGRANTILTYPKDESAAGPYITIVQEFKDYHNGGGDCIGLQRMCTSTEYHSYI